MSNNNDTYLIIYVIASLFTAYIINIFMEIFFVERKSGSRALIVSFGIFVLINNFAYFFVSIPVAQLGINIVLLFALTFNFTSNLRKRLISVVYIYISMMLIETIVVAISGYLNSSIFTIDGVYANVAGLITMRILSFLLVLLLRNYKFIKRDVVIPISQWICAIIVPIGTLYIVLTILQSKELARFYVTMSVSVMFALNLIVFRMYNTMIKIYEERINELLLQQQNIMYNYQLELMQSSMENINIINHDIKNHLSIIAFYLKQGNTEKAEKYLSDIGVAFKVEGEFSKSGNVVLDSILNYNIEKATAEQIEVTLTVKVPTDLQLPQFEMNILFSNLIDNAIEACSKLLDEKKLNISVSYNNGVLLVRLINRYDGRIELQDGRIASRKRGNHGIGLKNVRRIIDKYNGALEINYDNRNFIINAMLYIE